MKLLFSDVTPRWVPFVAAAMIVIAVWVGGVWQNFDVSTTSRIAIYLAGAFIVLIFFQGRYYWKGQVATLSGDGSRYELRTTIWVGSGKRVSFTPFEASKWSATARSAQKDATGPQLSKIVFTVKGVEYELSFTNPKAIDLAGLSAIEPGFFAKVKRDYPGLKSIGG